MEKLIPRFIKDGIDSIDEHIIIYGDRIDTNVGTGCIFGESDPPTFCGQRVHRPTS